CGARQRGSGHSQQTLNNKRRFADVGTSMKPSYHFAAAAITLTLALLAVGFLPGVLGAEVRHAFDGLASARPIWLWCAGACFVCSLAAMAGAWRSAVGLVGARLGWLDAGARYGIGSLVNSFAPARLGDVARMTLFSRALDRDERLWRTGGC